jgi:hypothetical protein
LTILERQVRRDDQAVALVGGGDHVEQQLGAGHNLASVAGTGDVMADFLDRELRK